MSPSTHPGHCFDAAAVLGIGTPPTSPLPQSEPGVILLRIPDGLSLHTLRDSPIGQRLMWDQNWFNRYQWSLTAPAAGTYRLRLPVPDSNRKTAAEQAAMLPEGEQFAPAALVAAALLCIHLQGGPDPLNCDWTRCAEQPADGFRVGLAWDDGRVYVYGYWGDDRYSNLWASSLRTSS